jgi:hypothetical protein
MRYPRWNGKNRVAPRTPVIYEIVRRLGEEEMARPVTSLWLMKEP